MRIRAIPAVCLLLAVLRWDVAHAAEEADLDDLDDDAVEGDDDAAADTEALEPVEDFDAGMSEVDKNGRMGGCFAWTMRRVKARGPQLEETIKELIASGKQGPDVNEERMLNTIVFGWMMTCYMNIEEELLKTAFEEGLPEDLESVVFTPKSDVKQQVKQASKSQWSLLEKVVMEETRKHEPEKQKGQAAPERPQTSYGEKAKSDSSSEPPKKPQQFGALYILLVLGVIFGLIILAVLRLSKAEATEKSSKKERKADKKARKQN